MINFEALRKARERMDDSKDGQFGRCGNWKIALGGYDHGYEVYYKEEPVMRVNYEMNEYEFYSCDYADAMFTQDTIPQIKKALEITPRFDNVGDIDDVGDYIDHFGQYVNGVEANVSESGGHKMKFKKIVKEGSEKAEIKKEIKELNHQKQMAMEVGDFCSVEYLQHQIDDLYKKLHSKDDVVKEERMPVMWAIDFRDMHSGIHGLYYAKDRKLVEEFYEALKGVLDERNPEYADDPELREMDYQAVLDEFYSRGIQEIDEINFRDIGKLPSGKYGIIIDDVEYRLVNVMNCLDVYEESKKVAKGRTDWQKLEDSMSWNLPINGKKELDELYALVRLGAGKFDKVAVKWRDRLSAFYDEIHQKMGIKESKEADDSMKWTLDINGKEELDELYSLVAAGLNSKTSDSKFMVAKKWRDKLGKFYGDVLSKKDLSQFDEANGDENSGTPRIYVGTYAKYNDGSLDGKWIDLTAFDSYEEFVDYCRALHKDEKDPEFMVQDFENYPKKWYHEGGLPTEEEFEKINEFYLMDDDDKDAYEAFVEYTGNDSVESFRDAYEGHFDSAEDFAYHMVNNLGWDGVGGNNLEMYFDYDGFGRDLMMDYSMGEEGEEDAEGNPQDPDHYYDMDGYDMGEYESDRQVAEDFIDNIGGVDQLGKETAERYFDYDSFGRDLLINDYFEENGYIFSRYY